MSSTDNTTADWREEVGTVRRAVAGMIRRMGVKLTEGTLWQAVGHLLGDNRTKETRDAEVFGTLGFYSRPKPGANAEVVVVFPGGSSNPVIIGTRDEELRATVANLNQGETAMCNRATIILCKPDGTVEIRLPTGTAMELATKQDLAILRDAISSAVIAVGGGGANAINVAADLAATTAYAALNPPRTPPTPPWPMGTFILKAQ